ncbi:cysteine synthase B [Moraxella macacae 0408225]|uniref:Cysteine synthase n=1 Tax=Moraxella macacae 0408225 TaxID=1230338 RepID=L2F8V8_9GAMM|nr:cysteine synthase CysM [Moraxella macacae]ELA09472.1 cysteine synthase B [Moraxella macacae 0408225]
MQSYQNQTNTQLESLDKAASLAATTLQQTVGNTPLVKLQRLAPHGMNIFAKLEGNNPAGSVKDRPALNMIKSALERGDVKVGDTLIEATSGNTGIALAMVSAMLGLNITLIMPKNSTQERKDAVRAYGATLIDAENMEQARDLAFAMQAAGKGVVLDQFNNNDNWLAHYHTTGPEIWQQTGGKITHFVSAMGTTGTIMGVAKFLKQKNPAIQIIGLQPDENSNIAGIRRWSPKYLPKIFDSSYLDKIVNINQTDAEKTMRKLAKTEGIFCGVSSGGAAFAALNLAKQIYQDNPNALIVFIVCDRGDRYLSTGLYGIDD